MTTIDANWTTEYFATETSNGRWHAQGTDLSAATPLELVEQIAAQNRCKDLGIERVVFRNSRNEIIDEYGVGGDRFVRIEKCRLCRRPLQRGGYDYTLP